MQHQPIFSEKYLGIKLANFELATIDDLEGKQDVISGWIKSLKSGRILKTKELGIQADFLNQFFGDVLGYDYKGSDSWNLDKEHTTRTGGKRSDGALGYFNVVPTIESGDIDEDVRAVIELKDARTDLDKPQNRKNDKRTPVEQAFSYASQSGGKCKWVIVSNFKEIRLYHASDISKYELFRIKNLQDDSELQRFFFLLNKDRLFLEKIKSPVDFLYKERQEKEEQITKKFYTDYKKVRLELFSHLKNQNKDIDELLLFNKSQKILDRLIFICFCEDVGLIDAYTFREILKDAKKAIDFSETKLWNRVKDLFKAINEGYPPANINKFNGGLFADDDELDNLTIKDEVIEHLVALEGYDFNSDLNVNILGHIFEQSISDIEEIKAQIRGEEFDAKKGKRKKEGIFYTPEYITRYIVKETVGGWLDERKEELGYHELPELTEQDFKSIGFVNRLDKKHRKKISVWEYNKKVEKHVVFWEAYKEKLGQIKVLDPACGSGAFLNQVFNYLYSEGQKVNGELRNLTGGQTTVLDLDRYILENNIYGVDLNPESVEITKLSLWLKTANREKELTSLDKNILCGNSLIDNSAVVGSDAFNWDVQFGNSKEKTRFDVVIGNPPYVRAELLGEFRDYLEKKYEVFEPASDLFAYFYEKSFSLLNEKGYFGFISNTFDKTTAGKALRAYLQTNVRLINYVDFTEVKVFEGATTYPIIFIAKNHFEPNVEFDYVKMSTRKDSNYVDIGGEGSIEIAQNSLDADNWSFVSQASSALAEKIKKHKTVREKFGKCYRGLITGLNEAFITTEKFPLGGHVKLVYEGKEIKKWHTPDASQKLILFKSKWTKERYGEEITEESGLVKLKSDFQGIMDHLIPFEVKAKKRYDKGDFWWELRNCAYYDLFEKPKIIFPNLQNGNKFCYDGSGIYVNAPAVFLPTDDKALLCILNSRLVWYFLKSICVVRSGGYIEVKPQYFEQIPIPNYNEGGVKSLVTKADSVMGNIADLQRLVNKVIKLMQTDLRIDQISRKLTTWYTLNWSELEKELKRQKVVLSLDQKSEWMDFFEEKKQMSEGMISAITNTEKEIDQLVYKLYGLSEEEIKIIET